MLIPVNTKAQAAAKVCPFEIVKGGCVTHDCMAWTVTEKYMSREDHSGERKIKR